MRRATLSALLAIALVLAAAPAHGDPIRIKVLSTWHTATLTVYDPDEDLGVTNTLEGQAPISDSLGGGWPVARARANLFGVSADAAGVAAIATSESHLWFSPVVDAAAAIPLSFHEHDIRFPPSARVFASLVDTTAHQQLWAYGDGVALPGGGQGVPWNYSPLRDDPWFWYSDSYHLDAELEAPTALSAGHEYHLTLWTESEADVCYVGSSVSVGGLVAVTDPGSTLLLLGMGLVGIRARRKR